MQISLTADILENEEGELLITFNAQDGEVGDPVLKVEGSSAILNRNEEQDILIENIHPDVREKLASAKQVMISEVDEEGVANAYYVKVIAG